jgi:hypothetical protein
MHTSRATLILELARNEREIMADVVLRYEQDPGSLEKNEDQ